jgi:predicted PurR-regulated permease PerM
MAASKLQTYLSRDLTDTLIRVGLIAALVYFSLKVFTPFLALMLWALILAVTLFPLHIKLRGYFKNKNGITATFLILILILTIGIPTFIMSNSLMDFLQELHHDIENKTLEIPQPPDAVEKIPAVGKNIHAAWYEAANNTPAFIQEHRAQLAELSKTVLAAIAAAAASFFQMLFSLIVAGIMLAYGESGSRSMFKVTRRIVGTNRSERVFTLSVATIRSVSMGVVGVSLIQALFFGIGFVMIGMPAAAIISLLVLVFGIAQLPAIIFTIPAVAYVWYAGESSTLNIFYTIFFIIAGFTDNILKPIFLGRGVDAPMPVVLLGAIGGLITAGLIGLFIGAVLLSLTYILFMGWVDEYDNEVNSSTEKS